MATSGLEYWKTKAEELQTQLTEAQDAIVQLVQGGMKITADADGEVKTLKNELAAQQEAAGVTIKRLNYDIQMLQAYGKKNSQALADEITRLTDELHMEVSNHRQTARHRDAHIDNTKALKMDRDTWEQRAKGAAAEVRRLNKQLNMRVARGTVEEVNQLKAGIDRLKTDYAQLEDAHRSEVRHCTRLVNELSGCKITITNLTDELNTAKENVAKYIAAYGGAMQQVKEATDQNKTITDLQDALKREVQNSHDKLLELGSANSQIAVLERKLKDKQDKLDKGYAQFRAQTRRIATLEGMITKNNREWSQVNANRTKEARQLKEELAEAKLEISKRLKPLDPAPWDKVCKLTGKNIADQWADLARKRNQTVEAKQGDWVKSAEARGLIHRVSKPTSTINLKLDTHGVQDIVDRAKAEVEEVIKAMKPVTMSGNIPTAVEALVPDHMHYRLKDVKGLDTIYRLDEGKDTFSLHGKVELIFEWVDE